MECLVCLVTAGVGIYHVTCVTTLNVIDRIDASFGRVGIWQGAGLFPDGVGRSA